MTSKVSLSSSSLVSRTEARPGTDSKDGIGKTVEYSSKSGSRKFELESLMANSGGAMLTATLSHLFFDASSAILETDGSNNSLTSWCGIWDPWD